MENTQQSIHASKTFKANVSDLYDAWINPDKLKEWWQPAGNRLVNVENNVRDGGEIVYEFSDAEGKRTLLINGQYKEVKPAQRLVYSWDWQVPGSEHLSDNRFELTVEFSGDENGSSIQVTQTNEEENESIHPKEKGWEDELERLNEFLG